MKDIFNTNQSKASSKVTINSFMMGGLFVVLALIWTMSPKEFSVFIISQIVLAIPLLFISSLAYAKIGHWDKVELWNILGWFCSNTGNIFILNAVGLVTAKINMQIALAYFFLLIGLMAIYSLINVIYKRKTLWEKVFKFLFFLIVQFLGGILPILLNF